MSARPDLLALTADTLAVLANRGLVKRAAKDLGAGTGPEVSTGADGTVSGRFPDGTRTVLPPGRGLDSAECSCAAQGVCRHRVGLVLAYQACAASAPAPARGTQAGSAQPAAAPSSAGAFTDWSPGAFPDEALTEALGRRALADAGRTRARGYTARLHRPTAEDPVPRVELPTCTVRFPVPHELGYALTDAAAPLRGEVTALAVWAFRAADEQGVDASDVLVGGAAAASRAPGGAPAALGEVLALAGELLLDGVAGAGPAFGGALRRARDGLTAAALHWPAGAVDDLLSQVDAYAARSAHYHAGRFALLLTELHARHRAAQHGGPARESVLGSGEARETALRRVRLVGLGCRVTGTSTGTSQDRTAHLYFAHPGAGIVLVLRRRWETDASEPPPTGHDLASRRLLGSPLRDVAAANVVSEHIARTASRAVTIGRGRIAATSVTPVGSAWAELPEPLLVRDVSARLRRWEERPPRLVRPRVEAESVHVLAVGGVGSVGYDAAGQRLEAVVRDQAGNEVVIRAEHNPLCPGGLDALAGALTGGGVRFVSGALHRTGGRAVLDPLAVGTAAGIIVPDLAAGDGATPLPALAPHPASPLATALEDALDALADAAHRGLRHLTGPAVVRLSDSADGLRRVGLHTAAGHVRALVGALGDEGARAAVTAWVEAQLRLVVSLEIHQEEGPGAAAGAATARPDARPGSGRGRR